MTGNMSFGCKAYWLRRGLLHPQYVLALGADPVLAGLPGGVFVEPVYGSPARWIGPDSQDEAAIRWGDSRYTYGGAVHPFDGGCEIQSVGLADHVFDAAHDPRAVQCLG